MAILLVTGAAGFIGSHTCDRLLAQGHRVVGLDNFFTGHRANLAAALGHQGFRLVEGDVADRASFFALTGEVRPDAIIHLAALVSVPLSIADPALNQRLNVDATHIVAEAARLHATPRVVFASSAAVYGETDQVPIAEDRPLRPISPYGRAKATSETILLEHAASSHCVVRCHRYFNVYGPRQDPHSPYSGVISIFWDKFRAGAAPTIYGDGEQTRDFVSVHDVARANVIAATAPTLASGTANICTGRPATLNALAAILGRHFPAAPRPAHAAPRAGDIRHSRGVPDRAQRELGFTAEVSLEDGLAALVRS